MFSRPSLLLNLVLLATLFILPQSGWSAAGSELHQLLTRLSTSGTRAVGSAGYQAALELIESELEALGLDSNRMIYDLPIRNHRGSTFSFGGQSVNLAPLFNNAITPQSLGGPINGPVYRVGKGKLAELDTLDLRGAIVVLDFDSGNNWQLTASLGAKACIFVDNPNSRGRIFFENKEELTPLQFPCFWMRQEDARQLFGKHFATIGLLGQGSLDSQVHWENIEAANVYTIVPGTDPELSKELLILEAFYDSHEFVSGQSPGADAASSIATLLNIAQQLQQHPPRRSVMLLATSGYGQSLAGMREAMWSLNSRSKDLRNQKRSLQELQEAAATDLETLSNLTFPLPADRERDLRVKTAITHTLGARIDQISRQLMQLRLLEQTPEIQEQVSQAAKERLIYRRLTWADDIHALPAAELDRFKLLLPEALEKCRQRLQDSKRQQKTLRSAVTFRNTVRDYEVAAVVSLHLSSHGNGVGGFHQGWLYRLKPTINRTSVYSLIGELLAEAGAQPEGEAAYHDSLRPSLIRSWDSWFLDQPPLAGEISALAGYLGLSLVTTGDGRGGWGTPFDTSDKVDFNYLEKQAALTNRLIQALADAPALHHGNLPRDGFVTVGARTNLLLQGELFANYPAHDTAILAYQGLQKYYAIVDQSGFFQIKGVADKKHVLDKLILEGYRFSPESGEAMWAIDKKMTGKNNYRVKLLRKSMQTDLVMFNCRETTLFDLLEPRSMAYMTKLQLYDGRRDAPPEHYWYSRIDTRDSIITSIYTEPGTRLKLTLSDTVITNKMVLTNGEPDLPMGSGYLVDQTPVLHNTVYHAAKDAWALLEPRITNLESHGIFDERISDLQTRGLSALQQATENLANWQYSLSREAAAEALALAARVYVQVEAAQKDVLFGVLFYIALFVPFAFVAERFFFNCTTIYRRIVAFSLILCLLIAVIYNVHPAFELAYSPMVVILAFFIIGLSFLVTLIIFFRFEDEMEMLQRRATHKRPEEISRWKAFAAAFFLGVSNLRRRRLRTLLTATTLVILTFTIMSFTTLKSSREQVRLPFQPQAPYQGLLLKKVNWQSLPQQATDILVAAMQQISRPAPRVWLEAMEPTRSIQAPVRYNGQEVTLQGLVGLDPAEAQVTGADRLLRTGRWFTEDDTLAILLEEEAARHLGVAANGKDEVLLWGTPFLVTGTFRGVDLDSALDLDGEPLTPVIFPNEARQDISEEEMEALESGDDVRSFQSRYQHIAGGQTAIVPARTLLAAGGTLKSIAVRPDGGENPDLLARRLSDRFSLAIFTGDEDGVWLYNHSDKLNYRGVPNIIIPLLISVLIVLNTMISSVYERKQEIGVYTSVGLAPSHVAFLFIAEAMAIAVLSVVSGYLVAQVTAALLAKTPLWQGITVNYSSLAGVAAMLLVMGVVLVSVIYPAKVAARIAIPDVRQSFQLPPTVNDRIQITLPFLMKYREHESIGGFIHDYLVSHRNISHGLFSTGDVAIVFSCSTEEEIIRMVAESKHPHEMTCLHLRASIWLAPFDFGIMQTIDISFCPAREGENFLEIKLSLQRQAGESGLWRRLNSGFLHELRKQLLIWRSLDDQAHKQLTQAFREQTSPFTQEIA